MLIFTGYSHKKAKVGLIDGIDYSLISADYTDFKLVEVSI